MYTYSRGNQGNPEDGNKDLWEDLSTLVVKHKVTWNWVKGHSGDFLNERADVLANKGINL